MADNDAGTSPVEGEAQGTAPVTPPTPDEVTTLRSRNAGLDAKVTELQRATKAAEQKAAEAAQRLADYEAGKVGSEEALRAQVAAKDAEIALARKEAALARVEAKYPETFAVLGEAAGSLSDDQLAAAEARFRGVGEVPETPTPKPLGANPQRAPGTAAKAIEDMSVDELRKHLASFPSSVMFRGND